MTTLCCEVLEALRGKTLVTAESCTGGLVSQLVTNVPGASEAFGFGFVTYANEAKMKLLGVSPETLEAHAVPFPGEGTFAEACKRYREAH